MLGVSVKPSALEETVRLLDMFPGVGHVQVKLPAQRDPRAKLEQGVERIRRAHPGTELSFHAYGQMNPAEAVQAIREKWLELSKDAVKQAADMGGTFVVFHGGSMQGKSPVRLRQNALNALCDFAEELAAFADDLGVDIHLENIYPAPFRSELVRLLDRVEDYRYVMSVLTHKRIRYCFDFGHAMIDDRGMPILYECMERLGSVHVHENDRQNDLHLPIAGLFDWQRHIEAIIKSGFCGPFILETAFEMLPQAISGFYELSGAV